jgi:antirestriction protein
MMHEEQPKQEKPSDEPTPEELLDQHVAEAEAEGGYINADIARRIANHLQETGDHGLKTFSSKGLIDRSKIWPEIQGIIAMAGDDEQGERTKAYALAFGRFIDLLEHQDYVIFDETGPTYDAADCCTSCGEHIGDPHAPECPHNHEENPGNIIEIYVASTRDLDAGVWIDATQGYDAVRAEIDYLLRATFTDDPDEWQVRASEGFGVVDVDSRSLSEIVLLAQEIDDHGEAFGLWVEHVGLNLSNMDDVAREFHQRYQGHSPSLEDFAQTVIEGRGDVDYTIDDFRATLPEDMRRFLKFDMEGYVESLRERYVVLDGEDGVYIFSA